MNKKTGFSKNVKACLINVEISCRARDVMHRRTTKVGRGFFARLTTPRRTNTIPLSPVTGITFFLLCYVTKNFAVFQTIPFSVFVADPASETSFMKTVFLWSRRHGLCISIQILVSNRKRCFIQVCKIFHLIKRICVLFPQDICCAVDVCVYHGPIFRFVKPTMGSLSGKMIVRIFILFVDRDIVHVHQACF